MVFIGGLKMPSLEVSMQALNFFQVHVFVVGLESCVIFLLKQSEMQEEQFATGILLQLWLSSY